MMMILWVNMTYFTQYQADGALWSEFTMFANQETVFQNIPLSEANTLFQIQKMVEPFERIQF